MLRKFDEAIEQFKMAIEKEPHNVEFLVHRAQCHYDMENFEDSIEDLQTALA